MKNIYDFQVGDKVFVFGKGKDVIISINAKKLCPIELRKFGTYTFSGEYTLGSNCQTIVHLKAVTLDNQGRVVATNYDYRPNRNHNFQPYDKVVCRRNMEGCVWYADLFSHMGGNVFFTMGENETDLCLPYNEETRKLLGTTDNWGGVSKCK